MCRQASLNIDPPLFRAMTRHTGPQHRRGRSRLVIPNSGIRLHDRLPGPSLSAYRSNCLSHQDTTYQRLNRGDRADVPKIVICPSTPCNDIPQLRSPDKQPVFSVLTRQQASGKLLEVPEEVSLVPETSSGLANTSQNHRTSDQSQPLQSPMTPRLGEPVPPIKPRYTFFLPPYMTLPVPWQSPGILAPPVTDRSSGLQSRSDIACDADRDGTLDIMADSSHEELRPSDNPTSGLQSHHLPLDTVPGTSLGYRYTSPRAPVYEAEASVPSLNPFSADTSAHRVELSRLPSLEPAVTG